MPTTHSQDQVSLRTWMGLGILMVPVLLVTISHTTLYFALPVISEALAPNAELLLAARIAMGVFGAVILPATHSLIRTMFEERKQRRLAIAIWSTGFAGGAAIGPLVGGWLIVTFGWPAVFLIAIPLLVVLAVGAPLSVRESRDPDPGRLDVVSIIRSAVTLAPIIAAIKRTVEHDLDLLSVGMGMISLIAGVLFVVRLLRIPNPMLDLRLLKRVGFTGPVLINLISGATMTWFLFFAAQHLQLVPGLSPLQAAWC